MPSPPSSGRAIVLGAGAGGGVPQWNCGCPNCAAARSGDASVKPATQASLALTGDGTNWVLFNASPDVRRQFEATPDLHPRDLRHTPVTDVILTGGEIDQIAGLLTMRERSPFQLHASPSTLAILAANSIFDALRTDVVPRLPLRPGAAVEAAGLVIEPFEVSGKVPLFREGDHDVPVPSGDETVGLLVTAPSGRRLAYVPGCAGVTAALLGRLETADIVLLDGTVFRDDEMATARLGAKTGRRMGHLPMDGASGTLELMRALAPRRRIYTHINNSNPVLRSGSAERETVQAAGIEIAFDGMEIAL